MYQEENTQKAQEDAKAYVVHVDGFLVYLDCYTDLVGKFHTWGNEAVYSIQSRDDKFVKEGAFV